jgi:enoyl-CoA hydratase
MEEKYVLREDVSERIALLTINRPKFLNALNRVTLEQLFNELKALSNDANVGCLIITGSGSKAFVAGADIEELRNMTCFEAKEFSKLGHEIFNLIENCDKPVIAAVNGYALGGGLELALSCDIRIAAENAKFGLPEINLGIIPGFGGTQRLPKVVGMGKAKEMIFTGKVIDAIEAERIGLVNKVVPVEELLKSAVEMANEIASKSGLALKQAKDCINKGFEEPVETGVVIERNAFSLCFSTEDQKEGMTAFLEKRKPEFSNK